MREQRSAAQALASGEKGLGVAAVGAAFVAGSLGVGHTEAFVGLRARLRGMVWRIVERGKLDDPEAVEAEVWTRVWGVYPRMRREERLRARGVPGLPGHRWRQWVSRTARRLVLDEQRRRDAWRRQVGMRAFQERDSAGVAAGPGGEEWNAPLEVDACLPPEAREVPDGLDEPDERGDPAALAERAWLAAALADGMAVLPRLEAAVLRRRVAGVPLRGVACELGVSVYAVRRAQEEALKRLGLALGVEAPLR